MPDTLPEVALITGGGSGIGQATAVALATRGARIALLDLNAEGLAETEALCRAAQADAEVLPFAADVTDQEQVENAVNTVVREWGGLRTVVASAGIEYVGTVEQTSLDDFHRVVNVALVGTFITAKASIPHLRAGGGGSFTAIGSTTAINGSNGWSAYSAAKHGVVGLIKCMALDHAREGIRVNAVLPGFIRTAMAERILDGLSESEITATDNGIPLGRLAAPAEVAHAVTHLSSQEAGYVTGMAYIVDGGTSAGFYEPPSS